MKNFPYIDLKNLLSQSDFQKIQDEIATATGVAMITVDYTGTPVTEHSECNEFCKFMRNDFRFRRLCERCDSRGGVEAARLRQPYIYLCHMGIVDFAIPIIVNGLYLGAVMAGQLLVSDTAEKLERIVAEDSYGSLSKYLKLSYEKLPKLPYAKICALSKIISYLCNSFIKESIEKSSMPNGFEDTADQTEDPRERAIIAPAIDYIDKHYREKISLVSLADLCGISPSYLSRLFKKVTGYKYAYYVNMVRIDHAKRLLTSTNKSVSDISLDLGFEDTGYFTKVFKKLEGVTPSHYRGEYPMISGLDQMTIEDIVKP